MDLKSASNNAFFDTHFTPISKCCAKKYFWGHISTFCQLWSLTRTIRLKKSKNLFFQTWIRINYIFQFWFRTNKVLKSFHPSGQPVSESLLNIYVSVSLLFTNVRRRPDRMGSLDKPPASLALLPPRASSRMRSNHALLTPQRRYEAIRVWSYTTFIVNKAVVNRKLAVET
jgi:hypothetical protein